MHNHEVGGEDLIHPSPGLEAVQVVPGGFAFQVRGFTDKVSAGGGQVLAFEIEHPGDRILSEPVDAQIGVQRSQLADD